QSRAHGLGIPTKHWMCGSPTATTSGRHQARTAHLKFYDVQESLVHDEEPLYLVGRRFSSTVNPSCPSTLTAPVFPALQGLAAHPLARGELISCAQDCFWRVTVFFPG